MQMLFGERYTVVIGLLKCLFEKHSGWFRIPKRKSSDIRFQERLLYLLTMLYDEMVKLGLKLLADNQFQNSLFCLLLQYISLLDDFLQCYR